MKEKFLKLKNAKVLSPKAQKVIQGGGCGCNGNNSGGNGEGGRCHEC